MEAIDHVDYIKLLDNESPCVHRNLSMRQELSEITDRQYDRSVTIMDEIFT